MAHAYLRADDFKRAQQSWSLVLSCAVCCLLNVLLSSPLSYSLFSILLRPGQLCNPIPSITRRSLCLLEAFSPSLLHPGCLLQGTNTLSHSSRSFCLGFFFFFSSGGLWGLQTGSWHGGAVGKGAAGGNRGGAAGTSAPPGGPASSLVAGSQPAGKCCWPLPAPECC